APFADDEELVIAGPPVALDDELVGDAEPLHPARDALDEAVAIAFVDAREQRRHRTLSTTPQIAGPRARPHIATQRGVTEGAEIGDTRDLPLEDERQVLKPMTERAEHPVRSRRQRKGAMRPERAHEAPPAHREEELAALVPDGVHGAPLRGE